MYVSIGHSASGYIDSELALEWLKWLDKLTTKKANGDTRVLHLDGHSTHTSLDFDDYAAAHDIVLVGYPPESTDRLQGLDVLHYSRVKDIWPRKVREWDASHYEALGGSGMLAIIHEIWQEVFTVDNNKKAFELTGLTRPVNPNAIAPSAIAPASGKRKFRIPTVWRLYRYIPSPPRIPHLTFA